MKKVLILISLMCLFLVGCGSNGNVVSSSVSSDNQTTNNNTDVSSSNKEENTEEENFNKTVETLKDFFDEKSNERIKWGIKGNYEKKEVIITAKLIQEDCEGLTTDEKEELANSIGDGGLEYLKIMMGACSKFEELGMIDVDFSLIVYDKNNIKLNRYIY